MQKKLCLCTEVILAVLFTAPMGHARLVRIEVKERSAVLDGKAFGAAGSYERIVGAVYFAVDPKLPVNQAIVDVDDAPRNGEGMVEFSADLYMLKPSDPRKGNGAVFYEVSNRGSKMLLRQFNAVSGSFASVPDPRKPEDFGDGFLLEQGYTLLWVGWQYDLPPGENLMHLYAPVLQGVKGLVRTEVVVSENRKVFSARLIQSPTAGPQAPLSGLGIGRPRLYPVLNPDDPNLKLTVRDQVEGPRSDVPRGDWQIENGTAIALKTGFEPGRFYELVYTSENPGLAGVGSAAIRDTVSWLKHGGKVEGAPEMGRVQRAYAWGASQTGRYLRAFLYYGFDRDENNRLVFDGVLADVAGGGRGSFNQRFALPDISANPTGGTLNPVDIFPFADLEQTDPATGIKDGLLTHALPKESWPKIFYINSAAEYYSRAGSLIHTTIDGKHDAPIPPNTRIYFFAGGQHGPAPFPPERRMEFRNLPNFNPYSWSRRALLVDMDAWVKDGKEPPPSRYPRIADGQLAPLTAVRFPKIPGIEFPTIVHLAYPSDFGPDFRTKGIITKNPPVIGKPYPVLVPQVDGDGNDSAGIRTPEIQVPLATYTGWNLRTKEIGAPDLLFDIAGSFIPFALTKEERRKSGDPRPSLEERYASREEYLAKFERAANLLVRDRFLLPRDVPIFVKNGAAEWDYVHKQK